MKTHLSSHHSEYSSDVRKEIERAVSSLEDIAWIKKDVQYPAADKDAIAELPVFKDCFQCAGNDNINGCGLLVQTKKAIARHCVIVHR